MNPEFNRNVIEEYYSNGNIRARLVEFLGGVDLDSVTAQFITSDSTDAEVAFQPRHPSELWQCLSQALEVGRSLWDRKSLIVDLDMEYVNFDQPAIPFVQAKSCYELQEPVVRGVQRWLSQHDISPFHWISGQGHHFAWRIDRQSQAFACLARLGRLTDSLQARYQQPVDCEQNRVGLELGSAFAGLGMMMEFVTQEIRRDCQEQSRLPVTLTAIEAGPVRNDRSQREVISLDISEYGDPLDTRGIRMPFSVYLKPNQKRYQLGDRFVDAMPPIFPVPLFEMDVGTALNVMRDASRVVELAGRASTAIPDFSEQSLSLIESYRQSRLARFHERFYRVQHDSPDRWNETYDRTPLQTFPLCVQRPFQEPNDLLLKPSVIQHVTRALLASGWHPRHIAGLIRSRYERDHGWGNRWYRYDAASRADFYVRMFAGAIAAGYDRLVDFNCVSTQEKHLCPADQCSNNLIQWKQKLVAATGDN